jgi:hypothetical protein
MRQGMCSDREMVVAEQLAIVVMLQHGGLLEILATARRREVRDSSSIASGRWEFWKSVKWVGVLKDFIMLKKNRLLIFYYTRMSHNHIHLFSELGTGDRIGFKYIYDWQIPLIILFFLLFSVLDVDHYRGIALADGGIMLETICFAIHLRDIRITASICRRIMPAHRKRSLPMSIRLLEMRSFFPRIFKSCRTDVRHKTPAGRLEHAVGTVAFRLDVTQPQRQVARSRDEQSSFDEEIASRWKGLTKLNDKFTL